jgi:FO synthase
LQLPSWSLYRCGPLSDLCVFRYLKGTGLMHKEQASVMDTVLQGDQLSDAEARLLADISDLTPLLVAASQLRDQIHQNRISYSRKVFIPLTKLCRDVCHYCTFAQPPHQDKRAYLMYDEVLAIARAGAEAGCKEALFTLGDKPELRYKVAARELAKMGHSTTLSYLAEMADLVFKETGLLPHVNPGVVTGDDIAMLRRVSVLQGLMLESSSERLCQQGGPHYGSPDKRPQVRLETIRLAGEQKVPFTTGILIGIGETRLERIESLLALRALHQQYGHIQEIIVQSFRAKPGTLMANAPEPDLDDLLWTLAVARLIFGGAMNIQAPPNLSPGVYQKLISAGLNDWGGVSPVTPDHVNPEACWPHLQELAERTAETGKVLVPRLAIFPPYAQAAQQWQDQKFIPPILQASDSDGYARLDSWSPGEQVEVPAVEKALATQFQPANKGRVSAAIQTILEKALAAETVTEAEIVRLFQARGDDFGAICHAANMLRQRVNSDVVSYTVNRNISYTNICYFRCQFCAFSKGKLSENLRGIPYDLALDEVARRAQEAWERGATEACMQGGIHPEYTGETYLNICRAVKAVVPEMHIHAFSPLEVWQGAQTLGISSHDFLVQLKEVGLSTLPGTAAEILDDEIRATLCPDKIKIHEWLQVLEEAHKVGLHTTSTVMYGHIEQPVHWARHLLLIKQLQARTGGITEFVPLPFVHMEAPLFWKGRSRKGPTFREAVLMHAVARLVLHPHITNIQVSWVKMGCEGVQTCLQAGANDLGGTLMDESISRAAGGEMGQELPPDQMEEIISAIGRIPLQRTTLYKPVPEERRHASFKAPELQPIVLTPSKRYARAHSGQKV